MSRSFSLFITGLIISTYIQITLVWHSNLSNGEPITRTSHKAWERVLASLTFVAFSAIMGAITLLMLSVRQLAVGPASDISTTTNGPLSQVPVIITFAVMGVGFLAGVAIVIQYVWSNGMKMLMVRRALAREDANEKVMNDLYHLPRSVSAPAPAAAQVP